MFIGICIVNTLKNQSAELSTHSGHCKATYRFRLSNRVLSWIRTLILCFILNPDTDCVFCVKSRYRLCVLC